MSNVTPFFPPIRAAQYLRMSTEHQRYSLENQSAAITLYACSRGYDIVQTYKDAGKSGLTLRGRDGLAALLRDALDSDRGFAAILVLDVSRWGRFQDPDQSAHYEFICRQAGLRVEYCGEPFDNDGAVATNIIKHLKRVMAGEYSRELSEKVTRAKLLQARLGHRQGGQLAYGFRRTLIDESGERRFVLSKGQAKALATDRVVVTVGSADEVAVIRRIFRMFVTQARSRPHIAATLNHAGVVGNGGAPWTSAMVRSVLSN